MRPSRDLAREVHATYDKTRCGAWLAATGYRPAKDSGLIAGDSLAKGPQPVEKTAKPMPAYACDVHPTWELP